MKLVLINVNYGELLGGALENVVGVMEKVYKVSLNLFNFQTNTMSETRGKLTYYDVSILLLDNMPTFTIMYIVSLD